MTFAYASVGLWVERRARLTPDRIALALPGRDVTYGELHGRSARLAGALADAGVGTGDRVAAYLPNGHEYAETLLACARLGAIIVPLSTRLAVPEIAYMVNDSGATALVYDTARGHSVEAFRRGSSIKVAFATGAGDAGTDTRYEDALSTSQLADARDVSPDDVLAIFYTSGTTGNPKGAMLTHGNFFWTNLDILLAFDIHEDERSLMVLPMFHLGGWNVNTLAVWLMGGTVVAEPEFDAGRALQLIESRRITSMMGVPTVYQLMADHESFATTDLSSVRVLVCGGAPLPVTLIRRFQERGVRFIQGYGLTEAAPNVLALAPEDAERKAGAAGRPYFFVDVRVVDADDAPVPPGASGEIVVRGPSVMKGYWNLPDETARALRAGWLRTGDVGRVDEDGIIWIVDRVKDMYISGGENVYPAEVENVLAAHPAVAEAAVIGVPHERWGEAGRAIVVVRDGTSVTAKELIAFCAERLAKFKVPSDVVFADALPRNPTGKLLKPQLREEYGR